MLTNFPAVLLIAFVGQAASIPMELPRLPTYTSVIEIECGQFEYSVAVENRGFTSNLKSSLSNGRPVALKTVVGENMGDLVAQMHSVSVRPSCRVDDGVDLIIRGVDMRAESKTRGTETITFVSSVSAKEIR